MLTFVVTVAIAILVMFWTCEVCQKATSDYHLVIGPTRFDERDGQRVGEDDVHLFTHLIKSQKSHKISRTPMMLGTEAE